MSINSESCFVFSSFVLQFRSRARSVAFIRNFLLSPCTRED